MKELTYNEKELLKMLDEIFEYDSYNDAYYQLMLIEREIRIALLKLEIEDIKQRKIDNLMNMGYSLN